MVDEKPLVGVERFSLVLAGGRTGGRGPRCNCGVSRMWDYRGAIGGRGKRRGESPDQTRLGWGHISRIAYSLYAGSKRVVENWLSALGSVLRDTAARLMVGARRRGQWLGQALCAHTRQTASGWVSWIQCSASSNSGGSHGDVYLYTRRWQSKSGSLGCLE